MDTSPESSLRQHDPWTAGSLAVAVDPISDALTCAEVLRHFSLHESSPSFAVETNDGFGLIDRVHCASVLAQLYGRALYEDKPVALIMDRHPLVVEADMGIEDVAAAIADSKPQALQSGFIVVREGRYFGVATGVDLMGATAAQTHATLQRLKAMQATLIESEKMASLGGLVGGVAHEINTPIGITLTAATQFIESLTELSTLFDAGQVRKADFARFIATSREGANLILSNARRAAELVQSFKQIAVDQASDERRTFDLGEYIRDVLRSLHPRLKQRPIKVHLECPEHLHTDGYPGALSQVLTNLITNALMHAFPPGAEGNINIDVKHTGNLIRLTVSDDGRGIPAEHLERVFEPFFTTKRSEGGSGLGLNIVWNIVTRTFGGRISVESTVGKGTQFTIEFPYAIGARNGDSMALATARFGKPSAPEENHAAI